MVHHFQCEKPVLTLQIDAKQSENDPKKLLPICVEFVDFDFITEKDDVAEKIKATNMFQSGQIFLATDSTIRDANRKRRGRPRIVTGARATVDEVDDLRKQLAKAEAELAKVRAEKAA